LKFEIYLTKLISKPDLAFSCGNHGIFPERGAQRRASILEDSSWENNETHE